MEVLKNSGSCSNLDLNIACVSILDGNTSMLRPNSRQISSYTPSTCDRNLTEGEKENLDGTEGDDFNDVGNTIESTVLKYIGFNHA